jgi:hypothetical protein
MAAMKKAELWAIFAGKNPSFSGDGDVTMSAASLRKFFDQTFDMGEKLGIETTTVKQAKAAPTSPPPTNPFDMFGGKGPFGSGGPFK